MRDENFFDRVDGYIRNTEGSIVNVLTAIAPWLAPVAPAAMSWKHMVDSLAFNQQIAGAIAFVVEVMGMASVSTIISFWTHNRSYRDNKLKAPTGVAIFTFVFYLAIILILNVVLDASQLDVVGIDRSWAVIGSRAALTLLTVPAAILLAIRTQHNELLDGMADEREQRRQQRAERRHMSLAPRTQTPVSSGGGNTTKAQFMRDHNSGNLQQALSSRGFEFDAPSIATLYNVSERTAFRWLRDVKETDE